MMRLPLLMLLVGLPLLMLLVGSSASTLATESDARQASVPHHDELRGALGARDASPQQQPLARVWRALAMAGAAATKPLAAKDENEVQGMPLDDFGRLLLEAASGLLLEAASGESGSGSGSGPAPPPPSPPPPLPSPESLS